MGWDELAAEIRRLRAEGKIGNELTREERISWVYGNCALSNPRITREMVERVVDEADAKRGEVTP